MGKTIQLAAADGHKLSAYRAEPEAKPKGGLVVGVEIFGVNSHIRAVADGYAANGYLVIAPALFDRVQANYECGYSQDEIQKGIAIMQKINLDDTMRDVAAAMQNVASAGKVGIVGYCWGGGNSLNFASKCKDLNAAVVYYGRNPDPLDSVANIPCPLMGNYAADDPNIMPGVEPLKAALAKAGKSFDCKIYPGAKHAFNNNTNADRYNPEAAKDAWARTASFFKKNLAA